MEPYASKLGHQGIAQSMLNQLTLKQASNVLRDLEINRDNYPSELNAKQILQQIIKDPWIKKPIEWR